ncbi:transposase [Suttonella ornithocola]|uniref:transposase n=1 Tax=Suttonella ornithocola TaxID=279832 RepID=UPI000A06CACD|nr:transposase [Suttonella ornithocola]
MLYVHAAFHKRESTKEHIENAGHQILWLPAYSLDLNPIEKKWAKVKHIWRLWKIDCIDTLFKVCMQC